MEQQPRFQAKYKGDTLGWYDTLAEAEQAIDEARQIEDWKSQLPDDLRFGFFEEDFDIEGTHYKYGAWNTAGDWWLAWNDDAEFQQQLASCEE